MMMYEFMINGAHLLAGSVCALLALIVIYLAISTVMGILSMAAKGLREIVGGRKDGK